MFKANNVDVVEHHLRVIFSKLHPDLDGTVAVLDLLRYFRAAPKAEPQSHQAPTGGPLSKEKLMELRRIPITRSSTQKRKAKRSCTPIM